MQLNLLANFTDIEIHITQQALKERFSKDIEIIEADVEIRLNHDDRELVERPILFWQSPEDNSKFIIMKVGLD